MRFETRADRTTRGGVTVAAPIVAAPVMLAEWKLEPDTGRRLVYRARIADAGGRRAGYFGICGDWRGLFSGQEAGRAMDSDCLRRSCCWGPPWWCGAGQRAGTCRQVQRPPPGRDWRWDWWRSVLAGVMLVNLRRPGGGTKPASVPRDVTFLAPVQQADSALEGRGLERGGRGFGIRVYRLRLAGVARAGGVGVCVAIGRTDVQARCAAICGWLLLAWAALRFPNGAMAFILGDGGVHVVAPGCSGTASALARCRADRRPEPVPPKHGARAARRRRSADRVGCGWRGPLRRRRADRTSAVAQAEAPRGGIGDAADSRRGQIRSGARRKFTGRR